MKSSEKNITREDLIKELKYCHSQIKYNNKLLKIIHPILLKIMVSTLKSELNLVSDNQIQFDYPVIYAVNHTNSHDVPAVSEVIKDHYYVLAGSENLRLIEKILFKLNGVIFVDRSNNSRRGNSKNEAIKSLLMGNNLLIFPEGTWNVTPNEIMMNLNWGIIDISKISGTPIVPITIDYVNNVRYTNVGKPIYFSKEENKLDCINKLRDQMATLRWEVWEKYKHYDRSEVSQEQFDLELQKAYSEYPKLDKEYEKKLVLRKYTTYDEAFEHLKHINYNLDNAYLLRKSNH